MRGFASAQERWNQPWTDPCAHFQCQVFDAVGAAVGLGDLLFGGAAAAAPAIAGGAELAGGPIALDILAPAAAAGEAAAPAAAGLTAGEAAAGLGAGAGLAGGALAAGAPGAAAADTGALAAGAGPPDTVIPSGVPGGPAATPIPTAPTQPMLTFGPTGGVPSGSVVPAAASVTIPPVAPSPTIATGFAGGSTGLGGPAVAPASAGEAGAGGVDVGAGGGIGSATGTAAPTFGDVSQFGVIDPTAGTGFQTIPSLQSSIDTALGGAPTGSVVSDVGAGGGTAGGGGAAPAAGGAGGGTTPGGQGFLSRWLGADTMATLKDIAPVAALGGLGYNLLNAMNRLPGQTGTINIPPGAAQTAATAGTNATTAAQQAQADARAAAAAANAQATGVAAVGTGQVGTGQQLETYLASGNLPPAITGAIRSAADATKANIRAGYATRGMSGSSAEAQDLAAADERASQAGIQVAQQLFQQGAQLVGAGAGELGTAGNLNLAAGGAMTAADQAAAATALNVGGLDLSAEQLAAQIYNRITQTALQQDQALGNSIGNFASSLAGGTRPGTVTLNLAGTPATTPAG